MAKIGFAKLGLKPNNEIKTFEFNEQIVEVKQYLSIEEKLELIAAVLILSHDENNFANPVKIEMYTKLQIIEKYTNLNFTEKQKQNAIKLYDLLKSNGFFDLVIQEIPKEEYDYIIDGIEQTVKSVYTYRNSLFGILEAVTADYSNLKLDADEIQKQLRDPETLSLVKDIVTKLG